jgi:hypothetical protein
MSSVGFEPAIPASERPQTHALDRAATGIGIFAVFGKSNFFPSILAEFVPHSPDFFQTVY